MKDHIDSQFAQSCGEGGQCASKQPIGTIVNSRLRGDLLVLYDCNQTIAVMPPVESILDTMVFGRVHSVVKDAMINGRWYISNFWHRDEDARSNDLFYTTDKLRSSQ